MRLLVVLVLFAACGGRSALDEPAQGADASAGDGTPAPAEAGPTTATCTGMLKPPRVDCGAQLASDPLNCGYCHHSCGGGACIAGVCSAQPLASSTAAGLAVVGSRLAFSDFKGHITFCTLPGCTWPQPLEGAFGAALAASGAHLYSMVSDGALFDIVPGTVTPMLQGTAGPPLYSNVATNGAVIVMADEVGNRVHECSVSSCAQTFHGVTISGNPGLVSTGAVAVDGSYVYLTSETGIIRAHLDGSATERLVDIDMADSSKEPEALWTDGCTLLWATVEQPAATVFACDLASCASTVRPLGVAKTTSSLGNPRVMGVAVDHAGIYLAFSDHIWQLALP